MAERRNRTQLPIHGLLGMQRQANFLNILNNKVHLALNCNNDILAALQGREGYTAFLNNPESGNAVRNVFAWKKANGDHRLFKVVNGKIYKYDWVAANWGTAVKIGLVTTKPIAHTILNNLVFISDGVITPQTYDDTTFTNIADIAAPKATISIVWNDRVYANDSSAKSVLFYSKRSDPTSWTNVPTDPSTGGDASIDEDNGFDIVGFSVDVQGNLIVHKSNGLYLVIPDEVGRPYEIIPLLTNSRATSHAAIAPGERGTLYFDRNGLFLSSQGMPIKISRPIQDLIKGVNVSNYPSIASGFFDDKFYVSVGTLSIGDDTFTNAILVYDNDTNEHFLYTFAHLPTCWAKIVDNLGAERFFFGSSTGQVYEFGTGTDDAGTPIEFRIVSKPYHFNLAMEDKSGYMFAAIHNPGMAAQLRYRLDLDQNADPIEVEDLAPDGLTKTYFEEGAVGFNFFSFEVSGQYSGERPVFYGIELDVATEGVR